MAKYVAFLRAINVGGHTVTMPRLRAVFEASGLSNVETFIASGNVIFDTRASAVSALERKIATALHDALGYEVATFIRTIPELAALAKYSPFDPSELEAEGNTLFISLLAAAPTAEARRKLLALSTDIDAFHVAGREAFWLRRSKAGESKVTGALLERTLGMPGTARNANTIRRLASKYC